MLGADLEQAGGGFPGNGNLAVLDAPVIEGGLQGAVLDAADDMSRMLKFEELVDVKARVMGGWL